MGRPAFAAGESIFSRGIGRHVALIGLLPALVCFGAGAWANSQGNPAWDALVLVTLRLSQLGHAMAVRSHRKWLWSKIALANLDLERRRPLRSRSLARA